MNSKLFLPIRDPKSLMAISEFNDLDPDYSDGICDYILIKISKVFKLRDNYYAKMDDISIIIGKCEYQNFSNMLESYSESDRNSISQKFGLRWYKNIINYSYKNDFWRKVRNVFNILIWMDLKPINLVDPVVKIQRAWRLCRDDPSYIMCKKVLHRNLSLDLGEKWANQFVSFD